MDKENKKKFEALVEEYATNWEDWCCLEERMEEFINNLFHLERLKWNKEMREMIGEYEKGYYNPNGKFRNAENAEQMVRNMFRKELLEQLEKKK